MKTPTPIRCTDPRFELRPTPKNFRSSPDTQYTYDVWFIGRQPEHLIHEVQTNSNPKVVMDELIAWLQGDKRVPSTIIYY